MAGLKVEEGEEVELEKQERLFLYLFLFVQELRRSSVQWYFMIVDSLVEVIT